MWTGAWKWDLHLDSGVLWNQMERTGIQDVTGTYCHSPYLCVVAIKQRYAGHEMDIH